MNPTFFLNLYTHLSGQVNLPDDQDSVFITKPTVIDAAIGKPKIIFTLNPQLQNAFNLFLHMAVPEMKGVTRRSCFEGVDNRYRNRTSIHINDGNSFWVIDGQAWEFALDQTDAYYESTARTFLAALLHSFDNLHSVILAIYSMK